MSVPKRRWLEKFSNVAGTSEVTFSRLEHEWTPSQGIEVPLVQVVGADYAVNVLGDGPMPKQVATERVRYLLRHGDNNKTIDEQVDTHRALLRQIGTGRLWRMDDSGNRQWARAQIIAMPDFIFGRQNREYVPVSIEFARLSDWYDETRTIHEEAGIAASPENFTVVNAGTTIIRNAVIELRSLGVAGFQDLTLSSLANGDTFSSSRAAQGSNSILRIDCGRYSVQYSNDAGATWTDDYGNFSYGNQQVDFFRLVPGTNLLRYEQGTGTPNLDIVVSFYPAYD